METWLLAGAAGVLFGVGTFFFQRKRRKKELEKISDDLARIIDKKQLAKPSEYTDDLISKIDHQTFRVQTMTEQYEETLKNDREEIKNLIAQIAHQLRTPLTNMGAYLEFLEEDLEEEERRTYTQAVKSSWEKIYFLTESFIKMSRLQGKVIQIQKEQADISSTLTRAVGQIQKKAEEKQIKVKLEGGKEINYAHDENWICEAVFNLLDNAVKYSKKGTTVRAGAEKNEMFLRIWVCDEGIGISPGEENKVFQRFYRGDNAAGVEGFGLGLFLTREIVLKHGGFMRIKREKTGTTVEIYLPRE